MKKKNEAPEHLDPETRKKINWIKRHGGSVANDFKGGYIWITVPAYPRHNTNAGGILIGIDQVDRAVSELKIRWDTPVADRKGQYLLF